MKHTLLKFSIVLSLFVTLINCENDQIVTEQLNSIETVSIEEAFTLFSQNSLTSLSSKSKNNPFVIPYLDAITQENIINSDELITIIPTQLKNKATYSRILLLKINDEIESVVFSLVGDEQNAEGHFYGRIYISDLEGNFINGFKVENNHLVSRLVKSRSSEKKSNIYSKGDGCTECPFRDCTLCGSLGEVVITANTKPKIIIKDIYYTSVVPEESEVEEEEWDPYDNGGGGGDEDQNKNNLCGSYDFTTIGNASVANITGLGFYARSSTGDQIDVELPIICVTIPNYNLPLSQSSAKFNVAWGLTMNEVLVYLTNTQGIFNPTPTAMKALILEFLITNLNLSAGINSGVSVIPSSCPGIPSTRAVYCP